jgi:hypothetical protein
MVHYLPLLLGSVNRMPSHSGCSCFRKLYISCHLGMGPMQAHFQSLWLHVQGLDIMGVETVVNFHCPRDITM